jgi:hypothetical protein
MRICSEASSAGGMDIQDGVMDGRAWVVEAKVTALQGEQGSCFALVANSRDVDLYVSIPEPNLERGQKLL